MVGDRYYKQEFRCKHGHSFFQFIWEKKLGEVLIRCTRVNEKNNVCNCKMKPYFEPYIEGPQIMSKMSKSEIKVDRRKRSQQDFVKNTLPGINPKTMEGKHFHKKYGTGAVK